VALSPDYEQLWLKNLNDDAGYGLFERERQVWLIIQPTIFYNQRKRLLNGRLVLGRMERSADHTILPLRLPDIENMGVSRLHSTLMPMEQGIVVEDAGSTNGTRLNGLSLVAGRTYNLNHGDLLEIGRLGLNIHFVAMDTFLKAAREVVIRRFNPEIQEQLVGMVAPTEVLTVLLTRLANRPIQQLQVVMAFKDQGEPMSLDKLHERINKVLGSGVGSGLLAPSEGEPTLNVPTSALTSEQHTGLLVEGGSMPEALRETARDPQLMTDPPTKKMEAPSIGPSLEYTTFLREVYDESLRMETQYEMWLAQAQRLENPAERDRAIRTLRPMLNHFASWLKQVSKDVAH
jgi:hypothetical protein